MRCLAQRQRTCGGLRRGDEGESVRLHGRREAMAWALCVGLPLGFPPENALAISNGSAVSQAWSALSGAPADLTFPVSFAGTWIVYSTLTAVDVPQGEVLLQDVAVVDRARGDVGRQVTYPMRFVRNGRDEVVMDRAYNVAAVAEATVRARDAVADVRWELDDPNVLRASLGDGRSAFVRVTQRSETYPAPDRIETSEVAEVVLDRAEGQDSQAKVKATRTFTKWKFRDDEAAGDGPVIVAACTVYDFLTPFDGDAFIQSKGQPVAQYTYRLALFRATPANLHS